MQIKEVREKLAGMNAGDLRLVAAQLYKMLPKKVAEEKRADDLLNDPQGFVKTTKAPKPIALPDPDFLSFETDEFLEDAERQHYFAPNRMIPKSMRGQWRFLARRLYREWCLVAAKAEHRAAALEALERLYKILCRGCEVYLFPSTETFRAMGVPQAAFLEQLIGLKSELATPAEWILQALAWLELGAHGDTTSRELEDVVAKACKTPDLKEAALREIDGQLAKPRPAASVDAWQVSSRRQGLIRLGFQVTWALGEKERAVEWLRKHTRGQDLGSHQALGSLFETKDSEIWMKTFEAIRAERPSAVSEWLKTFEHVQKTGTLPEWRVM